MTSGSEARIVLSSFPSAEVAAAIVRTLVEEELAACATLVPAVRSIYRWQGAVHDEPEALAVIKTTATRAPALTARLAALHPYEVPEILVLPVEGGHAPYLAWLAASTGG